MVPQVTSILEQVISVTGAVGLKTGPPRFKGNYSKEECRRNFVVPDLAVG